LLVFCLVGLLSCWSFVLLVICLVGHLSCWSIVLLVFCLVGLLSCWSFVLLVFCLLVSPPPLPPPYTATESASAKPLPFFSRGWVLTLTLTPNP
jgi:hypothetical protein